MLEMILSFVAGMAVLKGWQVTVKWVNRRVFEIKMKKKQEIMKADKTELQRFWDNKAGNVTRETKD